MSPAPANGFAAVAEYALAPPLPDTNACEWNGVGNATPCATNGEREAPAVAVVVAWLVHWQVHGAVRVGVAIVKERVRYDAARVCAVVLCLLRRIAIRCIARVACCEVIDINE